MKWKLSCPYYVHFTIYKLITQTLFEDHQKIVILQAWKILSVTLFPYQPYQYYLTKENTPKVYIGFSVSEQSFLKDSNDSLKSRNTNRWSKPQGTHSAKLQTYKALKAIWFYTMVIHALLKILGNVEIGYWFFAPSSFFT